MRYRIDTRSIVVRANHSLWAPQKYHQTPNSDQAKQSTITANSQSKLEIMQAMEAWISITRSYFVLGQDALSKLLPSMLEYRSLLSLHV
jgi:hypothetical protein